MSERLEEFLKLVPKHQAPPKECTIFSLGGRGYYENAASDLLAFFLRPDAEHGFGTLFLSTFFECMGMANSKITELTGATVAREVRTRNDNRIDLQILGGDWCLIVENKIWAIPDNPFEDYETHAKSFGFGEHQTSFAILSPSGESNRTRWKGIKYSDYFAALRRRLGEALFDAPHSKWHLFAREFILHIENELYNPTMKDEQAAFVEKYEDQIKEAITLNSDYRVFLQARLKQKLEEKLPSHVFSSKDQPWAIRCYSDKWGDRANLAFWKKDGKFVLSVYLFDPTKEQPSKAGAKFAGMNFGRGDNSWVYWVTRDGFDSRVKAIEEICRLAAIVADLLLVPTSPAQSGANVKATTLPPTS